ncbi:PTS mannose/fructose/sorbose/N-acetylgalactosamine transporter subunit IIC [Allobaculum mucilyticum]|uniref:PTS mannose/fructose/sorbose/N-acetylgalactosamine transporter subunit IIC n=1 Tax=Allobaculum mucilyticum TaxID=2834459 RepID=UPI001E398E28|nr:PTS sugar transporter subunit IIC [Allobaculum mucilyticum]UNT96562.1 PTS sugar transporter subunit IIC [Allobaculum mucilyticum]
MQVVLLAIVTFLFAIDQFSLTEIVYRPICACPIIGAILGDVNTGLVLGGTYELMMIGSMPVGGAQPANVVIGEVVAMIFAVKTGMDVDSALGAAVIFSVFGTYVVTIVFTIASSFNAWCDETVSKGETKGVTQAIAADVALLGGLFAVIAIVAYYGGETIQPAMQSLSENASWFMSGLGVAGGMMRFVGFGVLLKIMLSNDMWGYFLAGFAMALVIGNIEALASATLVLIAFIGIGIACSNYFTSINIKEAAANAGLGGFSDGI